MKKLSLSLTLAGVGLLSIASSHAGELRDWTNSAGKTISAEMTSLSGEEITLKMENGRSYTLPLSSLSAEDQTFAKAAQAEKEAIANAPKPKTETLMTVPGKLIFQSDFKEMPPGWSSNVGDWSAGESGLTGTERAADDHAAVMKTATPLKDVIIEYDVLLGNGKSAMFGIDNNDHMCRVTLTANSFQARKDDNDHEGPDENKPFNNISEEFDTEEWHTIRIELLGEEMLAQTGDHISLGSDPLLAKEKTKWGFIVAGETVGFRNLAIWEALPNEEWEKTGARLKRKLEVD
ncbi:hypothetical protein VSU19_10920 [Verrucomicrobiales bacterium BCK34]|nr:hypothetical protein [Verrucomicrobiales bacterium BCK34]